MKSMFGKKFFILAISGGVDSVVLLDMIAKHEAEDTVYIVAHFDHGIRPDSHRDALFVAQLAKHYGMQFELGEGKLGTQASEATAREARYNFLRTIAKKYNAEKIVTAHHQDDVLETMVLNILRGTGPRGLRPMLASSDILRPLLQKSKQSLLEYAQKHNLKWREDSTNSDEKYLRNYVRTNIMPKLIPARDDFLRIRSEIDEVLHEIDARITAFIPKKNIMRRSGFVTMPWVVQKEYVRAWLVQCQVSDIDTQVIERVAIAAKTLPYHKKIPIRQGLWLVAQPKNLLITSQ